MRNAAFYHPVKCCLRVLQNISYKSRMHAWFSNRDVTGGGGGRDLKNESKAHTVW